MLNIPKPQDIVLFLDIDGTLLDFAPTPHNVYVSDDLLNCIINVRTRMTNALAFVSGRMLDDVDRLFSPLKLPGAFSHGGEFRFPNCQVIRQVSPPSGISVAFDLAEVWRKFHPEIMVEFKSDALALHYRTAPALEEDVKEFAQDLHQVLGDDYHLLEGSAVVEIKPRHRNKGYGIAQLMKSPQWQQRVPVFIGDDITDEDGFKVVNEAGGLSIKVGEGDTVATSSLPNPHAVRELLWKLVA